MIMAASFGSRARVGLRPAVMSSPIENEREEIAGRSEVLRAKPSTKALSKGGESMSECTESARTLPKDSSNGTIIEGRE